jgi:2-polyprenyl-3-methyl-5-hydroxy-6-metoxy-1,4-benzoquinol methylase
VDQVGDAEIILRDMPAGKFDTIICCETLEHTVRPWVIVSLMREILTPGGYLWISAPTYGFPLHRYPIDCYRFADDAYRLWLFAGMILLSVETVKYELGQPAIVAAGQKWPLFG